MSHNALLTGEGQLQLLLLSPEMLARREDVLDILAALMSCCVNWSEQVSESVNQGSPRAACLSNLCCVHVHEVAQATRGSLQQRLLSSRYHPCPSCFCLAEYERSRRCRSC